MEIKCSFTKIWKMLMFSKRLYRTQKHQLICVIFVISFCLLSFYFAILSYMKPEPDFKRTNRIAVSHLIKSVLLEKGTGCELPKLDPFSEQAMAYVKDEPKIVCPGMDWVNCHKSECYVDKEILKTMKDVSCIYMDIVYVDDTSHYLGKPIEVLGDGKYVLNRSDHVKVSCSGLDINGLGLLSSRWTGYKSGFRHIPLKPIPPERKDTYNVMILIFDSTSHNGFLRCMPKSYHYLKDKLKAVILNGYSIVGDATPGALFPIFTGKAELEQPDARKTLGKDQYVDHETFIFHHLKEDGYRTAYLEDMPWIGTFQYRFNGFRQQPADHYLRALLAEEAKDKMWSIRSRNWHCIGAVPTYQFLMNQTLEFLSLDGKKFCFTFIAGISHDNFNVITNADEPTVQFLKTLIQRNVLEDTLVIVMGDHGTRFANIRSTYQGRIEERLPFMAILLPEKLKKQRPEALEALEHNKDVLTTHFDLHATLMDVMDLKKHSNDYKVPGADLPRAISLLEKIPKSRTCGEAGILPHWCVCTKWYNVSKTNPMYEQVAKVLADYIDSISDEQRDKCAMRKLIGIEWVMRLSPNNNLLKLKIRNDYDSYIGNPINPSVKATNEYYQAKIIMSPGKAVYEGTMVYNVKSQYFYITENDISRTSAYGDEPDCISATHPHLNKFCFCKDKLLKRNSLKSVL